MSVFSAYLNLAGLTDVGYRFYDVAEAGIGSRTQTGVRDVGDGWYSVDVSMPSNAISVRWDSAANVTTLCAREYLSVTVDNNAIAAAVWQVLVSTLTSAGTVGKLLVDNLNATVSSRSTYAGADTAGTTTLLSRIASTLTITAGKVDVNDKTGFSLTAAYDPAKTSAQAGAPVTVSTNNDKTGYTLTPAQVTAITDELLKRDWTQISGEANFSLLNATRAIRNAWDLSEAGILTVFKEDGTVFRAAQYSH
jgi:hypothetical protein